MNLLIASVLNETEKILRKKKTGVFLLVTVIIPIGTALLFSLLKSRLGLLGLRATDFPLLILGLFTTLFFPLFVFMWTADTFSGEAGDRTLKLVFTRPISRLKVYSSKILAVGLTLLLFLVVLFVLSLGAGLIVGGARGGWLTGFFNSLLSYGVAIWPMLALAIIAAFIAQFFNNSSGALAASILVYIGAKLLPVIIPQSARLLLVSYMDWHLLWLGHVSPEKLVYSFLFILSYMIIFFPLGYLLFDAKDL